jgi:hypothetical protein
LEAATSLPERSGFALQSFAAEVVKGGEEQDNPFLKGWDDLSDSVI